LPAAGYAVLVFWLGGRPTLTLPVPALLGWDKLQHALGFGLMQVLVSLGLVARGWPTGKPSRELLAALLATAVGGLLELYQLGVPGRCADWLDLLADAVGAALMALVLVAVGRGRRP